MLNLYTSTLVLNSLDYEDLALRVILVGFVIMGLIQYLPLNFLKENDNLCGFVKPRLFGVAYMAGFEVVFILAMCFAVMGESVELITILIFPLLGQSYQFIKVLSTRLMFDNYSEIIYKSFGRKRVFSFSEIRSAQRDIKKGYLGYVLILDLPDGGKISLAQMHFLGLEDLWTIFDPYTERN